MAGNVALVQSTVDGWESGKQPAANADNDWTARRFGAMIPEANISARRDASMDIVAALGVPSVLFVGGNSGTSLQESYRIFAVSTLEPLGELVAQELGDKLDTPGLVIRFDRVAASDVVRRATAFEQAGKQQALNVGGLDVSPGSNESLMVTLSATHSYTLGR